MFELNLENGANPNIADVSGETPLISALHSKYLFY
jgi:ankyrin repeat protein